MGRWSMTTRLEAQFMADQSGRPSGCRAVVGGQAVTVSHRQDPLGDLCRVLCEMRLGHLEIVAAVGPEGLRLTLGTAEDLAKRKWRPEGGAWTGPYDWAPPGSARAGG